VAHAGTPSRLVFGVVLRALYCGSWPSFATAAKRFCFPLGVEFAYLVRPAFDDVTEEDPPVRAGVQSAELYPVKTFPARDQRPGY